jgi:hypothetical protein
VVCLSHQQNNKFLADFQSLFGLFCLPHKTKQSRGCKAIPKVGVGWDHWAGKKFAEAQILRRFLGLFGSRHTLEVENGI